MFYLLFYRLVLCCLEPVSTYSCIKFQENNRNLINKNVAVSSQMFFNLNTKIKAHECSGFKVISKDAKELAVSDI